MARLITPLLRTLNRRAWSAAFLAIVWILASSFTYQVALPGRKIVFPRDHFSHPDFKTEWWYYTGHFTTSSGKNYGYQVTFFRFGLKDRQQDNSAPLFTDLYMAHFALSDKDAKTFRVAERANRGYDEKAGAATDKLLVWNEDWRLAGSGEKQLLDIKDKDVALKLRMIPAKPPVLHGDNGLSQKAEGAGRASYYYSFTRLDTEGELEIAGRKETVRGQSWMDHEFGSNQLADNQLGWDWFSLQLADNSELMLYVMRRKDGSIDPYSSGTIVKPDGSTRHLALADFKIEALDKWKSPKSGAVYPMKWKVTVPREQLELEVAPFFPNQELDTKKSTKVTYWEGSVFIRGAVNGRAVQGLGYVEMTGYAGKLKV
ncbi:MAG TPA: lipocalin-like domain-containing protein [Candidatus Binatia bacterium]|jgi:predicted secreted hydrolase